MFVFEKDYFGSYVKISLFLQRIKPAPNGEKIMQGFKNISHNNGGGGSSRTYDPTQHTIDPIAINKFDATKIDAILGNKK